MSDGDPTARRLQEFAEHLAGCQTQLLAHAIALVQNMTDAEDLCQKSAVVMWQKFGQYESGTSFRNWALKILQFEVFNFIRRRRRDRVFFSTGALDAIVDAETAEAESQDEQSKWTRLRACLELLPASQQRLIKLYYDGARTLAEVGATIKRSEATVRSSLCRARKTLRECIERSEALEEGH